MNELHAVPQSLLLSFHIQKCQSGEYSRNASFARAIPPPPPRACITPLSRILSYLSIISYGCHPDYAPDGNAFFFRFSFIFRKGSILPNFLHSLLCNLQPNRNVFSGLVNHLQAFIASSPSLSLTNSFTGPQSRNIHNITYGLSKKKLSGNQEK